MLSLTILASHCTLNNFVSETELHSKRGRLSRQAQVRTVLGTYYIEATKTTNAIPEAAAMNSVQWCEHHNPAGASCILQHYSLNPSLTPQLGLLGATEDVIVTK